MQVRSLSIKTTEILQLDLAIREEMENAIEELDALLFAANFDPMTTTQQRAISLRVRTLSQISQLLPEKALLEKETGVLTSKLEELLRTGDDTCLDEMLDRLTILRELLKNPPKISISPPASKNTTKHRRPQSRVSHLFIPYVAKNSSTQLPFNPEAETLQKIRASLDTEFGTTIEALRDILRPVMPAKEGRIQQLLCHAGRVFQDLSLTAKGRIPPPRPALQRIPCLILTICDKSFALPQKSVVRVLSPEEFRAAAETWECPGGRILKVNGQTAREIRLIDALGLSPAPLTENLSHILVETSRGAIVLAAETSGELIPLVPDHGELMLSRVGPYLGAAIHSLAEVRSSDRTILILNPEELAKTFFLSEPLSPSEQIPVTPSGKHKDHDLSSKVMVAYTAQEKLISVPMSQVSHVELVPLSALHFDDGISSIRIGQSMVRAIDPDEVISAKPGPLPRDIHDFQAIIMRRGQDVLAVLTREILGPKEECNVTDFGFDQKPGIRGAALCDDLVVCAMDPWSLLGNFSHFSKLTPNRVKIGGNHSSVESQILNLRTGR